MNVQLKLFLGMTQWNFALALHATPDGIIACQLKQNGNTLVEP
jgi:hypothetical protein